MESKPDKQEQIKQPEPELESEEGEHEEDEDEDQDKVSKLAARETGKSLETEVEPKPVESDEKKAKKWSLSSLNPKKAIYDARLKMPGRKKKVLQDAQEISNLDIVLEQLAHNGAYGRLDNTKLPAWGYREAGAVEDPESGFRLVLYLPTSEALANNTDRAKTIRAIHGGRPRPVMAFRGTDNKHGPRGVSDDVNRKGIGTYQFTSNVGRIEQVFGAAGGKAIVTGHSLGGALAQLAACRFPGGVARIVTFQSPGINPKDAEALKEHNAKAKPEDQVTSTHYRAEGDLVHSAGMALTKGDVFELQSVGIGNPMDHTQFPLARLDAARGDLVPGIGDAKGRKVDDKLVRINKSDSDEEKSSWKTRGSEWARKNLGGIIRDKDMEPYVKTWSKVKEMCESGAFSKPYVYGVIDQSDKLTDVQKIKMRDQVRLQFGE